MEIIVEAFQKIAAQLTFFQSPWVRVSLLTLKILMGTIGLFCIAFIIFVVAKTQWLKFNIVQDFNEFWKFKPYGFRRREKQWKAIMQRLETNNQQEYKLSILEADHILDEILTKLGIGGVSVDERIQKIPPSMLPETEDLQATHQIRNAIVANPDYQISEQEAEKILETYGTILRNLDII